MSGYGSSKTSWELLSSNTFIEALLGFSQDQTITMEAITDGKKTLVGENWIVIEDTSSPYQLEEVFTIIDTVDIDLSGLLILLEILSLFCTIYIVLAFLYVRRINREQNIKPNCIHKFFCPVMTVLRWEGFDGHEPLYALLLGNIYTVLWWTPSENSKDNHDCPSKVDEYMGIHNDEKQKPLLV